MTRGCVLVDFIGKRTLPGRWRGREAATRVRRATTEEVLTTRARGKHGEKLAVGTKGAQRLAGIVELRAHLTNISHSYLVMRRVARDILLTLV